MLEEQTLVNGLEANFIVAGEGEPLLILHGWGGTSDSWLKVMRVLGSQGYKIICPDFPGFGKSKAPIATWDVSEYTNWLLNFVNNLDIRKFSLFGHSFGGRVAIKFAVNYPEKLDKLILCDSAGLKTKPDPKTAILLFLTELGNTVFSFMFLKWFKDGVRNLYYLFLRNKDYVKEKGVMKEIFKKVIEEDLLPYLSKIKTKTLIIWGSRDRIVPLKHAFIFRDNIQNSQLEILQKIGHSPHLEVPGKLSEAVIKFLKNKTSVTD